MPIGAPMSVVFIVFIVKRTTFIWLIVVLRNDLFDKKYKSIKFSIDDIINSHQFITASIINK